MKFRESNKQQPEYITFAQLKYIYKPPSTEELEIKLQKFTTVFTPHYITSNQNRNGQTATLRKKPSRNSKTKTTSTYPAIKEQNFVS